VTNWKNKKSFRFFRYLGWEISMGKYNGEQNLAKYCNLKMSKEGNVLKNRDVKFKIHVKLKQH
jgi:hypothetical protein